MADGEDHPRACGEKSFELLLIVHPLGSPPRMRGKAPNPLVEFARAGITPAHAGKSKRATIKYTKAKDHPRACGEKAGKAAQR